MNIPNIINCSGLDLTPCCGHEIYAYSDFEKVTLHKRRLSGERRAIQFKIPTYTEHYPAKLEATSYNMFIVFEYTLHKERTSTRIDYEELERKFKKHLLILIND